MAMILKGNGGDGGDQKQKEKQKETLNEPIAKPGEVKVTLKYVRQGVEVKEEMVVPRSLIYAMQDPGESKMHPIEAMAELAEFHDNVLTPEFVEFSVEGGTSIPSSILSAQLQHAYGVHAVIAATDSSVKSRLYLENPEVDLLVRSTAALLIGVDAETVQALDLNERTVWVDRTVYITTKTPEITMKTVKIDCDCGSHKEKRDVSVPSGTTVREAHEQSEQRIARMPEVRGSLEKTYEKITALRDGNPLSKPERDAVVEHMNLKYIKDPKDQLIVTP